AKVEEIIRNPDAFIETLIQGYQRVKGERDAALNQVAELKPKADYCEKILQSPETLCVTVIAKDYGYSGVMFNQLLGSFKIQRRVGKVWVLYQDYLGKGYVETETVVTKNGGSATQMKWTQKGRMFLYDFLKARGFLPLCEKTMPDLFGGVA
ncbi:MAG: phage antirepressor KilAC domain-containing protein, partial [Selenomonadaceae bacterium]|nr:phage antirepressor KilAC domain-containing protein [Selenomonadaceae bacterium]